MSTIANVYHKRHFPAFASCPLEGDLASDFFHKVGPYTLPTRHWCLFAEVKAIIMEGMLRVADKSGKEFIMMYPRRTGPALKPFPIGQTLAILYPTRLRMASGKMGMGVWELERIMVIPVSGMQLLFLNKRVQEQSSLVDGKYACHACGERKLKGELKACAGCGLAWYCGKECQVKGWKEKRHKVDCKVLKVIKPLYIFDWEHWDGWVGFPLE